MKNCFVFSMVLFFLFFLVACTQLYNPLCPSVGRSVGHVQVTPTFFWHLQVVWGLLLLPNHLIVKFHHSPCPPARDQGSWVSGLVISVSIALKSQKQYLGRVLIDYTVFTAIFATFVSVAYLFSRGHATTPCRVGRYVGRSIGPSVCLLVRDHESKKCENAYFRPCPLVLNWYWLCIRPCYFVILTN